MNTKARIAAVVGMVIILGTAATLIAEKSRADLAVPYSVDQGDLYAISSGSVPATGAVLSKDEVFWLTHMREEEKLARDVYSALGATWNIRTFANIASSEQTHADSMKALLLRYSIEDPASSTAPGVFSSKEIQGLYDTLVSKGNESRMNALAVGATIEDMDIRDLDTAISATDHADIVQVYRNLQKGSRNHMRAFVSNISASGGVYQPQYISADTYQSIINSPQERGRI